jgi:hypothetical protein
LVSFITIGLIASCLLNYNRSNRFWSP